MILRRVVLGASLAAAASLWVGCGHKCGPRKGIVSSVIDGDTIELETGEKIRYLMVNTPETSGPAECYGDEARSFNVDLVEGREVKLKYDVECEDRFQRLLAYVSVDGREVNSLLVERGYACVLYIEPNGEDRREEFENLEFEARADNKGMWGSCTAIGCQQ